MTDEEFDEIKDQVAAVLEYSQEIEDPQIDCLMDDWRCNKERFLPLLDNKLIYESPDTVSFSLTPDYKRELVDNFCDKLIRMYNYPDLAKFVDFNKEGFFDNRTVRRYEYQGEVIHSGMKLVRAFKYFIENKDTLHIIQDLASQIIQESKVEGKFCISIHPLDYLSVSENTYNWRSCHALDGEYRAGNLSYMADTTTLVCYIKGEDGILPHFPSGLKWNSKKWRVLLYLDEKNKMAWMGRQYPFSSNMAYSYITSSFLRKKLSLSFTDFKSTSFTKIHVDGYPGCSAYDEQLWDNYFIFRHKLYSLKDYIKDGSELHYNDLLRSSFYKPHFSESPSWADQSSTPEVITIGAKVSCIRCGKRWISAEETMLCGDCAEEMYDDYYNDRYYCCDCCGASTYDEDLIWIDDTEESVCPDCYDNYYFTCPECGDKFRNEHARFDEITGTYVCEYCLEEEEEEEGE